ncbi:hypothetical protein LV75_006252 [Actinokineospora diospyrosa]|uniref:Uncharacterized protein n=1 Tax=Actinokineospora diospyrosa TaxID=103728 RepID=A0ABT1INK8_9PSEU|nr:hypothetical protein [Actinokineospora diospyrosa]
MAANEVGHVPVLLEGSFTCHSVDCEITPLSSDAYSRVGQGLSISWNYVLAIDEIL